MEPCENLSFAELYASDAEGVERMSRLATAIVKEHFDPIIVAAPLSIAAMTWYPFSLGQFTLEFL